MNLSYFWRLAVDKAMAAVICLAALIAVLPLFLIFIYLGKAGFQALNWDFFIHLPKPVGVSGGGMANAILGSCVLVGIACLLGIPIGVGTGIYLAEFRHDSQRALRTLLRFLVDSMNSIPSIVFGITAYVVIVAPLKSFSALSGGIVLGVMMIPVVTRTTEEFLKLVPQNLREAALALGATEWKVTLGVVLHASAGGIMTGIILAMARVAGETAPLLFTAFGNNSWGQGLMHPIAALPLQIFVYAIAPYPDWHRQAWAGALVLMGFILGVNILARIFVAYQTRHMVR
jgi:phosphate transport system permease protein